MSCIVVQIHPNGLLAINNRKGSRNQQFIDGVILGIHPEKQMKNQMIIQLKKGAVTMIIKLIQGKI